MFGDNDKKTPKLRLLKVVVQPVMVVDDGESLQEVAVDPITVTPTEWPTYAEGRFQEQVKALQEQLDSNQQGQQAAAPAAAEEKTDEPSSSSSSF